MKKRYVPLFEEYCMMNEGYSNDGFGGIDWSCIINPEDEGDYYLVRLWCGSGYMCDVYLVKASDEYDAMDKVFAWSYKNEGANDIVFDYDYVKKEWDEEYSKSEYQYEDFDDYLDREYVWSENGYYTRSENFNVEKVPDEIVAKKINGRQ